MQRLKLAVILPLVFCDVEGLLRYWSIYSQASIRNVVGRETPADFTNEGLNAPVGRLYPITQARMGD